MARYLVTGGCGFIGSHLCDALLAQGHAVRVVDNLATGRRRNLHPAAELIVGDCRDEAVLIKAVRDVDVCYHLAAIASVRQSVEQWADTHTVNQTAFIRLVEALARSGRSRVPLIYASSAAVYGDNANLPLSECDQQRPLTPYGADKYGCELHARVAGQIHGIPSVGMRFFNVYGPRQAADSPYSGVISRFIGRLLASQPITIYGDGSQTRDFIYVGDVVRCLLAAGHRFIDGSSVINVCTGRATSINQLARSLLAMIPEAPPIHYEPRRPGDIQHSVGSPAAMLRTLGIKPAYSLGHGLRRTLGSCTEVGPAFGVTAPAIAV